MYFVALAATEKRRGLRERSSNPVPGIQHKKLKLLHYSCNFKLLPAKCGHCYSVEL
jgi:hypothetical protein